MCTLMFHFHPTFLVVQYLLTESASPSIILALVFKVLEKYLTIDAVLACRVCMCELEVEWVKYINSY